MASPAEALSVERAAGVVISLGLVDLARVAVVQAEAEAGIEVEVEAVSVAVAVLDHLSGDSMFFSL